MAVNKVVYDGKVLIDLTNDTVSEDKLLVGTTAHDKAGNLITGTYEELDISVETAEYTSGLNTQDGIIDQIAAVLESGLAVPSNLQSKAVTPSTSQQTVVADKGYDVLSSVIVEAIPQSYTNQIYQNGYNTGNETGYSNGYNTGYSVGYDAGIKLSKPYKQELEYIESTGTQYIDVLFVPNQNTRVVMDAQLTSSASSQFYFSARTSGGQQNFGFLYNGSGVARSDYGESKVTMSLNATTRVLIDKNKNVCTVNGTVLTNVASTFTCPNNLALFASLDSGNALYFSSMILYSCQIYDNGTLIRDYIPVLDWNNNPCLYDKINKRFYYNAGTGAFMCDYSANLPTGYTLANYIQSSGTQRIDTGIAYNANNEYVIETECKVTSGDGTYSGWNAGGAFGVASGKWSNGAANGSISATTFTKVTITIQSGSSTNSIMVLNQNGTTETITRTHPSIASYATTNYPIFAYTNNSGGILGYISMQCKYLRLYQNGELVRNFIPCKNGSSVVGLYDLVNDKFYTNAGTGSFTYA